MFCGWLFYLTPSLPNVTSCCLQLHAGCQYSRDISFSSLVTSELNHTVHAIQVFWDWNGKYTVVIWYLHICYYNVQISASWSARVFFVSSAAQGLIFIPCNLKVLIKVYETRRQGTQSWTAGLYSDSVTRELSTNAPKLLRFGARHFFNTQWKFFIFIHWNPLLSVLRIILQFWHSPTPVPWVSCTQGQTSNCARSK